MKVFRLIYLVGIILIFPYCNSIEENPDTTLAIEKFEFSYNDYWEDKYPDSALVLAKEILEIERNIKDKSIVINALNQIGDIYYFRENYDSALFYYKRSLEFSDASDDIKNYAKGLHLISNVNIDQKKYYEARINLDKARTINHNNGFIDQLAANYSSMAVLFESESNYQPDSAIMYYLRSIEIFDSTGDLRNKAIVQANVASLYNTIENFKDAITYHYEVIDINKQIRNYHELCSNYNNLGVSYLKQTEYDSALHYFNLSNKLATEYEDPFMMLMSEFNIGKCYSKMGNTLLSDKIIKHVDSICIENDILEGHLRCNLVLGNNLHQYKLFEKEKNIYNEGIKLAIEHNFTALYKEFITRLLHLELEKSGQPELNNLISEIDSLDKKINEESLKQTVFELEQIYQTNKKEREIIMLQHKEEIYQRKIAFFSVIAIFMIMIVLFLLIFYNYYTTQLKQKKLLLEAENKSQKLSLEKATLQAQLKDDMIRKKEQELVYNALSLSRSAKLFQNLKNKLLGFQNRFQTKKSKQEFQSVLKEIDSFDNNNTLKQFEDVFNKLHPGFYKSLIIKYPELTKRELQLCSMLRLNMSTKEIAAITFLAPTSIDTARSRIRKKMGLSSNDNLIKELLKV